jgi:hypothetical protein
MGGSNWGWVPADIADRPEALPTLLIGTTAQIADQVRESRERYGFSYVTVLEPSLEKFAPVIELLR